MWPVAPKTIHTLGVGGLDSEGGSVLGGSERRGKAWCDEGDVGDGGEVAAIAACWDGFCYMLGLVRREGTRSESRQLERVLVAFDQIDWW
jgi:hypothetical protein